MPSSQTEKSPLRSELKVRRDPHRGHAQEVSTQQLWSILYTRPGMEKALAQQLHRAGILFYLPQYRHPSNGGGDYTPLFARYLFLYGSKADAITALSTGLVSRILPVAEQDKLRWELLNLQYLLIDGGIPVSREPDVIYGRGAVRRVEGGALDGLVGLALESSPERLYLGIECLKMGISIPIEGARLKPVA